MKKKPRIIISATAVVLCAAAFAVFYFAPVNLSNDELENALWRDALARAALTGAIAGVAALCNYNIFFVRGTRMRGADYLWCLPCLAVALANFPYSALISGTAVIERADDMHPKSWTNFWGAYHLCRRGALIRHFAYASLFCA